MRRDAHLLGGLAALVTALALASLLTGPADAGLRAGIVALWTGEGPLGIVLREIRAPRTVLAGPQGCAALTAADLGATSASAAWVGAANGLPAYCEVTATLTPTSAPSFVLIEFTRSSGRPGVTTRPPTRGRPRGRCG